jgi:hypothetical protein
MKSFPRTAVVVLCILLPGAAHQPPAASADGPSPVDRLVCKLGIGAPEEREAADEALFAVGRAALQALRKGANSGDAEVRRRSRVLIERIDADVIALRGLGARVEIDRERPDEQVLLVDLDARMLKIEVGDADLARLERFDSLGTLYIVGRFTDEGLAHVWQVRKHLGSLQISQAKVTDAGLGYLEGMTELGQLTLYGCRGITDEGLTHLHLMKQLRSLNLDGTAVTDRGLEHLEDMTSLWQLSLFGIKVTDAGLQHLQNMKELQYLSLEDSAITDAGLPALTNFPKLKMLLVSSDGITDAGLPALKGLQKQLTMLSVSGPKITAEGIAELRRSLPKHDKP